MTIKINECMANDFSDALLFDIVGHDDLFGLLMDIMHERTQTEFQNVDVVFSAGRDGGKKDACLFRMVDENGINESAAYGAVRMLARVDDPDLWELPNDSIVFEADGFEDELTIYPCGK